MAIKLKVKATGKDAKKVAAAVGTSLPDTSGANYVSRNDLHEIPGTESGKLKRGKEHLEYPASSGGDNTVGNEARTLHERPSHDQYTAHAFPELHYGDAQVKHELECREVQPVTQVGGPHALPDNSPEMIRRRNNRARDMRTNLGKSRPMAPATNE